MFSLEPWYESLDKLMKWTEKVFLKHTSRCEFFYASWFEEFCLIYSQYLVTLPYIHSLKCTIFRSIFLACIPNWWDTVEIRSRRDGKASALLSQARQWPCHNRLHFTGMYDVVWARFLKKCLESWCWEF